MTPRPIIIDTDPGQDDAAAILAALGASGELDVVALTAVAGNVPLPLTSLNSLKICELAGRPDVPVYAGCERPMVNDLVTAEYVHGESGLAGADLPEPEMALQDQHAVDFLVDALLEAEPQSITLCPIGPLTNVAMAMVREPRVLAGIREIVLMGGGFFEGGNITPTAEFNIYADPHAADVVFRSGVPTTVMPLDVTHQVLATPERLDRIAALGTAPGRTVAALLGAHGVTGRWAGGAPVHDPCVIAYLLEPGLFGGKECFVEVDTRPGPTMGMTIVDWWGRRPEPPNVTYIREVDDDGFFDLIVDCIGRL